jgi:protocatechuate 3,4-dioxygenase beta subunit
MRVYEQSHDHDDHGEPTHDHDRGLSHDLPILLNRRRLLALFGTGAGAVALAACGADADPTSATDATPTAPAQTSSGAGSGKIPEETGGPYPADGSNGANVLNQSGIVRGDITRSFGASSTVARGVPLTITLTVLDTANGSSPLVGAAVYLWHCDIDGQYSLYSKAVAQENYLRGVQETGADGSVKFTSIYPAAYSGRWPHIHFEVYPSLDQATTASGKLRTSQLALPEETNRLVYATAGYEASVQNLSRTTLANDMVFSDGYSLQLATVTGSVDTGLSATLRVPV